MQSRPEPIAGSREMMPGRARVQTWIDAAEQDVEIRRDDVLNRLAVRALEVRARNHDGPVSAARRAHRRSLATPPHAPQVKNSEAVRRHRGVQDTAGRIPDE